MMASLAEVVLVYPQLPDIFMSLHRLQKSFARRRLRQKNKNVFQQPGGIVDAPLGASVVKRFFVRSTRHDGVVG